MCPPTQGAVTQMAATKAAAQMGAPEAVMQMAAPEAAMWAVVSAVVMRAAAWGVVTRVEAVRVSRILSVWELVMARALVVTPLLMNH